MHAAIASQCYYQGLLCSAASWT